MSANRSPRHPSIPLDEAIDLVRKIFDRETKNAMHRETAAKHLGYKGISGASAKALGNLAQFDLLESVGDSEVQVSSLTLEILAPESDEMKYKAVLEAAERPKFYKELSEKFPDGTPHPENLTSFMIRQGFNNVALKDASESYLKTREFVEETKKRLEEVMPKAELVELVASETLSTNSKVDPPAAFGRSDANVQTSGGTNSEYSFAKSNSATLVEDVFTVEEGRISLTWPREISNESYLDMKDWLELVLRKIERKLG